jgi:RNA polymerase sigma factor (sigma-70 family)
MTDELLVVRCRLGEREALAELVRAWNVPLWTYVRRMLGGAAADDVTQEVWLAVLRGLPRIREPDRFAPWLFTIARRTVMDRLRREYAAAEDDLPGDLPGEEDPAGATLDRAELLAGLAALPVREREILVLFYLEDLPVDDCARICAIPAGTVKSRLSRARRMLREHLTERGYRP